MPVLLQPLWLLLLIPLVVTLFLWPMPTPFLRALRAVSALLMILALCHPALRLQDRSGVLIVVADRSDSMPPNAAASQKEIVDLLTRSMGARDSLGLVSFGRLAAVERPPQRGEFGGFSARVGLDHSNVNDGIEAALGMIPADTPGRILVVSDGKWTGRDPAVAAARAAGRGVKIDYRLLSRPQANEVAIQSFEAPQSVLPGQAYLLTAWIQTPAEQEIRYELRRGTTVISSGTRAAESGLSRLMFRDRAGESGVLDYTLHVEGSAEDPVPENNRARALVGIDHTRPLMIVSGAGAESGLARLLQSGGVDVVARTPAECQWTLEELSGYSGVVIENVPAGQIGNSGMETLASWVEETASGLMLTGGKRSYGPGGYFKSPLDRVLPISMEMRREHRKLTVAVVVALDRSGSMAAPVGGGRSKMDLANIGTAEVLDLLSGNDEMGVLAVDTVPHMIVPLDTVEKNRAYRQKILTIQSMGGGIFVFEALTAAARMLVEASAETRHIILFADANDSEEPGNYRALLEKCREANITVSVVALGTERDADADLLKDIAARGGGTCYFTEKAEELPRLFAQDTFTIARSTFIEEPSPFQFTAAYSLLGAAPQSPPPLLGGYNLCYIRPEAALAAVTTDEYQAPVVASWNAGAGRVLCYLGEADGNFSGAFAQWEHAGDFYATLARWTAGYRQPLGNEMMVTQELRDGACFVRLHLDPERTADPFVTLPRVRVLHGVPGTPPSRMELALQWKTADLLEVVIPLSGGETTLNTVDVPGQSPLVLAPVTLPYSPEFAPERADRGPATLARIAATTGGQERLEVAATWKEMETRPHYVGVTPWLIVLAAALFLIEILERRTGWISRLAGRAVAMPATAAVEEAEPAGVSGARAPLWRRMFARPARRVAAVKPSRTAAAPARPAPPVPGKPSEEPVVAAEASMSTSDILRKARERAGKRTGPKG